MTHPVGLFNTDFGQWWVDCSMLTDHDLAALAWMLSRRLPAFGSVEGEPRLAAAMTPYATSGPLLIVGYIWTTGASMERTRAGRDAIGAVVFFRPLPGCVDPERSEWIKAALFVAMPETECRAVVKYKRGECE